MMKNLKKVLALVLVFAMSLSVVAFAGAAYPDVDDAATYAEAVRILKSLGIMKGDDQGNFNPDKTVTRGEMATILCNLTGVGAQAPVDTGFADTTSAHWASGYVAYAKNAGWINGYDANTFGPDDVVKWEQAVKLIMAAANWGIYAEENGGYPTGWVMAGAEAEITRAGAAGGIGEDCTRAKVAMLLYYALDANTMKQTAFGDKKWEIQENETLLSKYLDTYKVEGKVANSFKHDDDLDEGYIDYLITKNLDVKVADVTGKIGAVEKYTGEGDDKTFVGYALNEVEAVAEAADLLGYTSIAYIKVDDNDDVAIVAIAAKGARNKSVTISDMDLVWNAEDDYDADRANRNPNFEGENKRFCYWNDRDEDNFITTAKVDDAYMVVKNNTTEEIAADATTEEVLAILVPAAGTIEMTDTDNDGDIDLFNVYAYGVAVVDAVNAAKQRVLLKEKTPNITTGSLKFDVEEVENLKDVSITLDGEEIAIEDLAENDVLTISCNNYADPRYYTIAVSRATVEGKVTGIASDNESIFIGGVEYEVVDGLLTIGSDVEMSDEGIFYLDATGKIAAVDSTTVASSNYGIVDKFAKDSMGTVSMRLLTLDGSKLTANVADKVKVNGVKVVLEDALADIATVDDEDVATVKADVAAAIADMDIPVAGYAYGKTVDGDLVSKTWYDFVADILAGTIVPAYAEDEDGNSNGAEARLNKLITYDTADGEIDEITFAIASNDTKKFGYVGEAGANVEWQAKNSRFQGGKTLSDSTVVFNLAGTIDDWKIAKAENLVDENEYRPYYFAMQNDGTVGAVVIFSSTSNINQDASLAYFVDARQGVYELANDEEDVYFVNYYVDGALAAEALPVYEDEYVAMTAGTAFLFAKDDKGIVDQIVPVFTADVPAFYNICVGDVEGALDDFMKYNDSKKLDNEVYYGVLVKAASGKLTVAAAPAEDAESIAFDTFENIVVPETAKVLQYKAYASTDAKKLVACDTIVDLEASSYVRVTGTQDINLAESDLTYVFFRMNNGVVTEVVGLDYVK